MKQQRLNEFFNTILPFKQAKCNQIVALMKQALTLSFERFHEKKLGLLAALCGRHILTTDAQHYHIWKCSRRSHF